MLIQTYKKIGDNGLDNTPKLNRCTSSSFFEGNIIRVMTCLVSKMFLWISLFSSVWGRKEKATPTLCYSLSRELHTGIKDMVITTSHSQKILSTILKASSNLSFWDVLVYLYRLVFPIYVRLLWHNNDVIWNCTCVVNETGLDMNSSTCDVNIVVPSLACINVHQWLFLAVKVKFVIWSVLYP